MIEQKQSGRWTHEQHIKFIEGLKLYGKNWKKIENLVGTRSGAQVRSHAQKFFNRLNSSNKASSNFEDKESQYNFLQQSATQPNFYLDTQHSYYFQHLYSHILNNKNVDEIVFNLIDLNDVSMKTKDIKKSNKGFSIYKDQNQRENQKNIENHMTPLKF